MSLDDDYHASSHTKVRARRSMDIELHENSEHLLAESLGDETHYSSSHHNPVPVDVDDSDDDSFGEASDGSVPDHKFLAEILEEYHPERLNLLDPSIPEPLEILMKRRKEEEEADKLRKANAQPASVATCATSNTTANKDDKDDSDTALDGDTEVDSKVEGSSSEPVKDEDSEEHEGSEVQDESEANEESDAFTSSPRRTAPGRGRPGLDRTKLLESMGTSQKKSLRTINGTFWSKPFKGLARSIRRPGSQKGFND